MNQSQYLLKKTRHTVSRFVLSSIFSFVFVTACGFAAIADAGSDPATIGTVQAMSASPKVLSELKAATQHCLDAAINDQGAFFASIAGLSRNSEACGSADTIDSEGAHNASGSIIDLHHVITLAELVAGET